MTPPPHPQNDPLQLLLVDADSHEPALPEGLAEGAAVGQRVPGGGHQPEHLWDEGGDPNDLAVQRWGVIAPEGVAGDRLLAAIAPLVEARRQAQGAEVRVYRVPPRLDM